ncbi:hypothetical protein EAF00_005376 [Botryotinia globosa]|nr:hypothetical protein EAF00_005376 [Botryotinia globosa]
MARPTLNEMFETYGDAVRGINIIKSQLMGGKLFYQSRPPLITYLPNDVNRYWEILEDLEEHLDLYEFSNTYEPADSIKAFKWYYEGGKDDFELKVKDIYNPIAIYVPATLAEITRIKNDARMTFVVLTKRKRMIEGIELWFESDTHRQKLNRNSQHGGKSQLESFEDEMRARDAKDLGTLYLILLYGLNTLIHSISSVKDPYKSAWNLKEINIRGQLEDLHIILSERLTDLHKVCERCRIEEQGSEESKECKQIISRAFIKVLIHIDYLFIEISDTSMYRDTITNYIRERKSLNYVSEMKDLYTEESQSYYTAWEPQFPRRVNAIINGIRIVIAVLHNGRQLLGIS